MRVDNGRHLLHEKGGGKTGKLSLCAIALETKEIEISHGFHVPLEEIYTLQSDLSD